MKTTSMVVVSLMSALAFGAAVFPLTTSAADVDAESSTAGVCAATVQAVSQDATQASQSRWTEDARAKSAGAMGYCYFDCSPCETSQECRDRGAGYCTSIPLCYRAPPESSLL